MRESKNVHRSMSGSTRSVRSTGVVRDDVVSVGILALLAVWLECISVANKKRIRQKS
jgi:hypothetical protein